MNILNSNRIVVVLILLSNLIYSQSNLKTWTQITAQDFLGNQLTNIVVNEDSSTIVSLNHPLVKTTDDYLDNSTLRFITKDSAGNFVHAWNSTNGNIYVQKYSANGKVTTKAIRVNEGAGNIYSNRTSAAILNDGTYIVMWMDPGNDNYLYCQIFKDDSIKVGNNFKVNEGTVNWADGYPIANNVDHNFLLLYTVRETYPDDKLYIQKRDVYGNKIGEIQRLNKENYTTLEYDPKAVSDKNGFWVLWNGYSQDEYANEYDFGLHLRHFKFDGTPLSDTIHVVTGTRFSYDLCMGNYSSLLISWEEQINTIYGGTNILGQLFDSTGVTVGSRIRFNSMTTNTYNTIPDIEFSSNEFNISWLSWSDELNGYATYVNNWKFDPKLSGEMISSVFDGSPTRCLFDKLYWDYNSNVASDLKFQLRSGNTIEELNNSQWYGPTSSSDFYTGNTGEAINKIHNGNRYIQYKAYFTSEYGNSAELKSISINYLPYDTDPPIPPYNLTASNNQKNVFLNWGPSTSNDVAVYKIYRGVESQKYDENWSKVVSKDIVSYTDSSALVGKKYYYAVTAIDSSHNESSFSNETLMIFRGSNIYVSENGSPTGNGSINNPVQTIQQGMDLASPGDTLNVMPGNYSDKFSHKARVSLVGSGVNNCILNCEFYPPDDCIIKGFTITKTIHCEQGAPTITENVINCSGTAIYLSVDGKELFSSAIITKNFITGCSYGIYVRNSVIEPTIRNNIINARDIGIGIPSAGNPEIINNTVIVSGNEGFSLFLGSSQRKVENNICVSKYGVSSGNALSEVTNYNDLWCKVPANFILQATNILLDPKFVNEDVSDYQLLPDSPCKDAGNPDPIYNDVDGTRNDMGAYGGPDPFDLNIISQLTRSIYVSSLSGYAGDTISVSISLDKTSGLAKADFSLEYDNNVINFINVGLTEATRNFNLEHQVISSNKIKFSISSAAGAVETSKDILKLNFVVNPQSKTNDASQLLFKDATLLDTLSTPIFLRSITNGAFIVNNTSESQNYIYVDSKNSGTGDGSRKHPYKTIAAGINKAESGDTVLVAGGDYYESLNMKEGVSLIGSGSSVTNIIGTGDNYGILFDNVKDGEISGFTFKTDNEHLFMSAFLLCQNSSPVIKKNRFETQLIQNTAIGCWYDGNPIIENNYLDSADIDIYKSSPIIKDNNIKAFQKGIFCAQNSNPTIIGNQFKGFGSPNMISLSNSGALIKNNFIYCKQFCTGISLFNAAGVKIYNNIIKGNGSDIYGIDIYETQNADIINNTIIMNNIGIRETSSIINILNNIIVNGSEYGIKLSSSVDFNYNAFWNNSIDYEASNPGNNNIHTNILFADTSKENYRLLSNSPCINAGNPDSKYNDTDGSRNDIGAYGGPYADSSWTEYSGSTLALNQATEQDTIEILITGEQVKGIAELNLGLSFDSSLLTVLEASSSDLTKAFSLEKTNLKSGSIKLHMKNNNGITDDNGRLIKLRFVTHSSNATTTLHIDSASVWDETACSRNILSLKDAEIKVITGISKNEEVIPTEYALYQNYPNPFNPSTTIKYQLPENSNVSLTVYDILGRIVAVLEKGYKKAGTYSVTWNASKFASGVYIARISTGTFDKSIKLLLLK